ncbi:MAG: hypothetical protein KatS3mg022_1598 [Armatimonadota bacterium]|nr:MAG: hypothetical protein KatS3mg022_1598 [Armatimonadota bacterium]
MVPPEIPARRGMSCWTVGLLSCLGAVALVLIGLAILFVVVSRRPEFRQAMSTGMQVAQCQQNMQQIYAAIERYRQRNKGAYPKDLNELVPRYLSDAGKLKCPADTSGKPVSYRYFQPQKNTPDTSPLLQCDHHQVMNQQIPVLMLKNGQLMRPSQVGGRDSSSAPAPEVP